MCMYSLYKRGRVYWVRLNGERLSTKQIDRKAAEAVARELERRAADPAYKNAQETRVDHIFAALIEAKRGAGCVASTIRVMTSRAGHFVRIWENCAAAKIDAKAVDSYIAQRRTESVSNYVITKEISLLKQVLRHARRRGDYPFDPADVIPPLDGAYVPRKRWLKPEEVDRFLDGLRLDSRKGLVAFMVATGARLGEATRARRCDVDLEGGYVHLRGTKTAASTRVVPITPLTRRYLELALSMAGTEELFRPWPNSACCMARTARRLGMPTVNTFDLRRTHASWLIQAGVRNDLVAKVLGHTTTVMVDRVYGKYDPHHLKALIERNLAGVPEVYLPGVPQTPELPEKDPQNGP